MVGAAGRHVGTVEQVVAGIRLLGGKDELDMDENRCSLCNSLIEVEVSGWNKGHNPWPLRRNETDRCCQTCNDTVVMPARLRLAVAVRKKHPQYIGDINELND